MFIYCRLVHKKTNTMFWRKKIDKSHKDYCSKCGTIHQQWPALAFNSPVQYNILSAQDKAKYGKLNSDFCEIRFRDQIDRFIRVTLCIYVEDSCQNLEYGLWVSVSEASYNDYKSNFDNENHKASYFGYLCNNIYGYESTEAIPCTVMTQSGNERPIIFPNKDYKHPFVRDCIQGISKAEAEKRVNHMLNS